MVALFGRYAYVRELGQGASARVIHVVDRAAGEADRALKVLPRAEGARAAWELSRLSELRSPHLACVHELLRVDEKVHGPFGIVEGSWVLVEDLAPGEPAMHAFEALAPSSAQRVEALVRLALQASRGLCALHEAGLVHGDVKPSNLLCTAGAQRVTLIDLGLSRAPGLYTTISGTPSYLSPEAWVGVCSPAQDVYALGATLFDLWLAEGEEPVSTGSEAPFSRLRDLARLPRAQGFGLSALIEVMLADDPKLRPVDATRVLEQLGAVSRRARLREPTLKLSVGGERSAVSVTEHAARASCLPFVGHADALAQLTAALDHEGLVQVTGPSGSGRTRLSREAVRLVQQARAEAGRVVPTFVTQLSAVDAISAAAVIAHVPAAEADDVALARRLLSSFRRTRRELHVVLECDVDQLDPSLPSVTLGPLSQGELEELLSLGLRSVPSSAVVVAARDASLGLSGRLSALLAQAFGEGRDLTRPDGYRGLAAPSRERRVWSEDAERLALALAFLPGQLEAKVAHDLLGAAPRAAEALAELRIHGVLQDSEGGVLQLASAAARPLRTRALSEPQAMRARLEGLATPRGAVPFLSLLRGATARAIDDALTLARLHRARAEPHAARELLLEMLEHVEDERLRLSLSDTERALGRYADALTRLEGKESPEALLRCAELLRLLGRPQRALEVCAPLTSLDREPSASRARALAARAHFDLGHVDQARAALAVRADDALARVAQLEVEVLVAWADGHDDAGHVHELVTAARGLGEARPIARALLLAAQAAVRRGDGARARTLLSEARDTAAAACEEHEAATALLNLGLVQLDLGELGEALDTLRAGVYRVTRLGREADALRALYNLANAALLVGDVLLAESTLGEARALSQQVPDAHARASIAVLEAELELHRGAVDAAADGLFRALAEAPATSPVRCLLAARAALACLLAGRLDEAARWVEEAAGALVAGDARLEGEVGLARGRLRLAASDARGAEAEVSTWLALRPSAHTFELEVRLWLLGMDTARTLGLHGLADARAASCRHVLERAMSGLSSELRGRMRAVPAYVRVLAQAAPPKDHSHDSELGFRRLVRASRRLFSATSPKRLGRVSAELALELVQAERALLIVQDEQGELFVLSSAALGRHEELAGGFSRSIVERVWSNMQPLVSVDAQHDARLDAAQSVHALHVRSVVSVPLRGFGVRAALYVDDRLRPHAFGELERTLLSDLAELTAAAARALDAARAQRRAARRATQRVRALEQRLSVSSVDAPRVELVGDSVALQRVLGAARRVADSDVPVLIRGESGTGKELLARLIHTHSPRAERPFVAESCAALPDALLESALFGHVRGAFTGADRAREGLFAAAHGGTLFLDEIGEMSPAMQAKLLRVLQDGELRPVGSDHTRRVDVRLLCATHRDLRERVQSGSFREDLLYRIAVVELELPALRERREDIPQLVSWFVEKHARGRGVRVTPRALSALTRRPFPGNVRQLESEVRRALALAADVIDTEHLSEPEGVEPPRGLDLHENVAALQRSLVARALDEAGGNQTRAAELLGVSRFGLQKMLKRLAE
jgi:transcriptional regulator with GAF, ATPase, and Fis domain